MIKSVRCNPVVYDEESTSASVRVIVEVDAADLLALFEKEGIDPSNILAPYVVVMDGVYGTGTRNLKEAADMGLEVSNTGTLDFSFYDGGSN